MEDDGRDCFVEKKLDPRHSRNFSLPRNKRCLFAIMFIRYCMWLTICQMPGRHGLVLCVWCDCNLFSFPLIPCVDARSLHAGRSAKCRWQGSAAPPCPGIVPAADHHGSWGVLSGGQNAAAATAAAFGPARQTAGLHVTGRQRQGGSSQQQSSYSPAQPLHQRQGWYAHLYQERKKATFCCLYTQVSDQSSSPLR